MQYLLLAATTGRYCLSTIDGCCLQNNLAKIATKFRIFICSIFSMFTPLVLEWQSCISRCNHVYTVHVLIQFCKSHLNPTKICCICPLVSKLALASIEFCNNPRKPRNLAARVKILHSLENSGRVASDDYLSYTADTHS